MSNAVSDEPITCASCEYRYSSGKGICPMCGTAAQVVEPLQSLAAVPDHLRRGDHEPRPSSSDTQPRPPHLGLRRLLPIVVVLIGLMAVTSFFYKARKGNEPKESGPTIEPTATLGQIKPTAGKQHIVRNPVRGVKRVVAGKLGTAQTTNAANEDDPVELWKAVKRGSVSAEVALANLYLEGAAVPQNCEQAHVLLHAASMKGSKAADNSLKSSYAERCK